MAQHKMWYSYYVPVIVCRPIFNAVVRRTCAARTLCVGLQGFSGPKKASHFVFDPFLLLRFAFTQHQKDRFWQKIQKNTCVAFLKRTPLDAKSGLSDKSPYSRRRHGQQISFAEGFGKKSSDCSHPRHRNAFIIQLISHQAKESESQIMKTKKKQEKNKMQWMHFLAAAQSDVESTVPAPMLLAMKPGLKKGADALLYPPDIWIKSLNALNENFAIIWWWA